MKPQPTKFERSQPNGNKRTNQFKFVHCLIKGSFFDPSSINPSNPITDEEAICTSVRYKIPQHLQPVFVDRFGYPGAIDYLIFV